ncbi:MAG: CvpA family protein [Chitinophagaceae bacterium]|nr:CvpA family protein [Chitinophagaceae bacterium]
MLLDLIFVVILVLAIFKGFRRGLIVGIFSFVAIIIGLAAAIKLSTIAAAYIGDAVKISDAWLPILSFAVVFIIVVLLVRLGANAIQRTVEFAMLGWVNRLGGIILYAALYITVLSVLIFYAEKIHLIKQPTIDNSLTYSFIQPWGPKAINAFGVVIPWFKDMFLELELFFDGISQKVSPVKP